MESLPWREAWHHALYGDGLYGNALHGDAPSGDPVTSGGFYRGAGPAAHFTTSTHGQLGAVLAQVLSTLADHAGVCRVVDIGCGRGELLTHLHQLRPDLDLLGVDVVPRPSDLPEAIDWMISPGGSDLPEDLHDLNAFIIAHEWLDVLPCTIADVDDSGTLREVLVDHDGNESLGDRLGGEDLAWVHTWWPEASVIASPTGSRVEVGRSRDLAWRNLLSRNTGGLTIAVDYGHTAGARPPHGTLTAYRQGAQVSPIPDGTCDLTAHVATDSLGASQVLTQREVLRACGFSAAPPPRELAHSDPGGYLAALSRASVIAALSDPHGLGGFHWAFSQRVTFRGAAD